MIDTPEPARSGHSLARNRSIIVVSVALLVALGTFAYSFVSKSNHLTACQQLNDKWATMMKQTVALAKDQTAIITRMKALTDQQAATILKLSAEVPNRSSR